MDSVPACAHWWFLRLMPVERGQFWIHAIIVGQKQWGNWLKFPKREQLMLELCYNKGQNFPDQLASELENLYLPLPEEGYDFLVIIHQYPEFLIQKPAPITEH